MRTALIVGGAAVGLYFLWKSGVIASVQQAISGAVPVAQVNPNASASMVQGASAVSQIGPPTFRGLMLGTALARSNAFLGQSPLGAAGGTVRTAGTLLLGDLSPKPVTLVPTMRSGTTAGTPLVVSAPPPPQQLNPTINPNPYSYRTRGVL